MPLSFTVPGQRKEAQLGPSGISLEDQLTSTSKLLKLSITSRQDLTGCGIKKRKILSQRNFVDSTIIIYQKCNFYVEFVTKFSSLLYICACLYSAAMITYLTKVPVNFGDVILGSNLRALSTPHVYWVCGFNAHAFIGQSTIAGCCDQYHSPSCPSRPTQLSFNNNTQYMFLIRTL